MIRELLSFVLFPSLATGLTINVSPKGCTNNCTSAAVLSISQAQAAARHAISSNMNEDIVMRLGDGVYYLDEPLTLTSADSGQNGHTVRWEALGNNATFSGGLKVDDWTLNSSSGIWQATVPKDIKSRNLFVNGWAANYARRQLNFSDFTATNTSFKWNSSESKYDWLMSTPGIKSAEMRLIGSFTDRYAPIEAVGNRQLIMAQQCWRNQVIGYDNWVDPFADFGLFVQNALALLDEGGEYYLDSEGGRLFYLPLEGEDMKTADTYLGILEAIVVIGGDLDDPAHDISFSGINFAHSTWLRPATHGYVDQQTGGYIGQNVTYPDFEASRELWWQMPGAIQISAAHNIHFQGGNYTQLGAGGFGIGNDPNAHISGVGLGAKNISISGGYFTQVMGNSITAGGIQIPAHHPNDTRMINSDIQVRENIFYNNSALFSSTVPVFFSYVQDSSIVNNDIAHTPYSGICIGYGWGMNDAGGSQTYITRGTYDYQPLFLTPTTSQNNLIQGNIVSDYGFSHTDLGAIYTLSKSPSTRIIDNCVFDSSWYGLYTDEGSNSYIVERNTFLNLGNLGSGWGWYNPNQGIPIDPGMHTANNTLVDNLGVWQPGRDFTNAPEGSGVLNNTFLRNFIIETLQDMDDIHKQVAYRAGIPPVGRTGRPVSNPTFIEDASVNIIFPSNKADYISVSLANFDDGNLTNVSFDVSTPAGASLKPISAENSIPGQSVATAKWQISVDNCNLAHILANVSYTNSRTGLRKSISQQGTMPGYSPLSANWSSSSTWPATFGQLCGTTLGIRTGGRNINGTYDDWAVLGSNKVIGENGVVSVRVTSVDDVHPGTKAGIAVRDSFKTHSAASDASHLNATGYAALSITPSQGLLFQWSEVAFEGEGNGYLNRSSTVPGVSVPVYLQLNISSTYVSAYYSDDGSSWKQVGNTVLLPRHQAQSRAGLIVNSHGGFKAATAQFDQWTQSDQA